MRIEIDQSGKVEHTNKNTVIAFSDGRSKSIFISAKDKREVQKFFRSIGKPRVFVYRVFAILVFLLIKDNLREIEEIVIDEEYEGNSKLIKNFLLGEIHRFGLRFPKERIRFDRIGKKSEAHFVAYNVAKGKRKADIKVRAGEIKKIVMTK
jgi:hypothetical protein